MPKVARAKPNGEERARIEYHPLPDVESWPRNPKRHDLDSLGASIGRFGFVMPLLRDEKTKRLVAGHGRLEQLRRMKDSGSAAPERIVAGKGGEWLVPVICGVTFRSAREAEAYLLADNRQVELGGWDDAILGVILKETAAETSLAGTGWSTSDFVAILDRPMFTEEEMPDAPMVQHTCPHCGGVL